MKNLLIILVGFAGLLFYNGQRAVALETIDLTYFGTVNEVIRAGETFQPQKKIELISYNKANAKVLESGNLIPEIVNRNDREDLICLAMNVYFEARNSTFRDKISTSYVVKNRVDADRYPPTICDVVWDYKQFSWTNDGKSDYPTDADSWYEAQHIALLVQDGILENEIGDYTHYHAYYVNPKWSQEEKVRIGAHYYMSAS